MRPQSARVGRVGDEAGAVSVVAVSAGRGSGNLAGVCGEREISAGRGSVVTGCWLLPVDEWWCGDILTDFEIERRPVGEW